jgi:hypothetical protein
MAWPMAKYFAPSFTPGQRDFVGCKADDVTVLSVNFLDIVDQTAFPD